MHSLAKEFCQLKKHSICPEMTMGVMWLCNAFFHRHIWITQCLDQPANQFAPQYKLFIIKIPTTQVLTSQFFMKFSINKNVSINHMKYLKNCCSGIKFKSPFIHHICQVGGRITNNNKISYILKWCCAILPKTYLPMNHQLNHHSSVDKVFVFW